MTRCCSLPVAGDADPRSLKVTKWATIEKSKLFFVIPKIISVIPYPYNYFASYPLSPKPLTGPLWYTSCRYFYFVILLSFFGFFRRLVFFYSIAVGVIGSRQAKAGEPITITLISERKHIVCLMSFWFWVLILQQAIFFCVCAWCACSALVGFATECGCWRNLPHQIFPELKCHSDL